MWNRCCAFAAANAAAAAATRYCGQSERARLFECAPGRNFSKALAVQKRLICLLGETQKVKGVYLGFLWGCLSGAGNCCLEIINHCLFCSRWVDFPYARIAKQSFRSLCEYDREISAHVNADTPRHFQSLIKGLSRRLGSTYTQNTAPSLELRSSQICWTKYTLETFYLNTTQKLLFSKDSINHELNITWNYANLLKFSSSTVLGIHWSTFCA